MIIQYTFLDLLQRLKTIIRQEIQDWVQYRRVDLKTGYPRWLKAIRRWEHIAKAASERYAKGLSSSKAWE